VLIRQDRLEEQLIGGLINQVLRPEMIEYLFSRFVEELQKRLQSLEQESLKAVTELNHLQQKRKELMIIYGEDLSDIGYAAAELRGGGKAYARWPTIEEDLVARAKKKIIIAASAQP